MAKNNRPAETSAAMTDRQAPTQSAEKTPGVNAAVAGSATTTKDFPVVGIGASAGGLTACRSVFHPYAHRCRR